MNLATNTATVEYDPARVQPGDFVGAIEELGLRRSEGRGAGRMPKSPGFAGVLDGRAVCARRCSGWAWRIVLRGSNWRSCVPVIFYSGAPFYTGGLEGAAASLGQYEHADLAGHGRGVPLFAVVQTVLGGHDVYFEAAA